MEHDHDNLPRILFLVGAVAFAAIFMAAGGCQSPDGAKHALEQQGFTEIKTTGYAPLSCGEGDLTSTGFTAKNPQGRSVSGVVCCGVFKNCTVRW